MHSSQILLKTERAAILQWMGTKTSNFHVSIQFAKGFTHNTIDIFFCI